MAHKHPLNKNAQIAQNFLDANVGKIGEVAHTNFQQEANRIVVGTIIKKSPHRLSFFERQTATALGKTLTDDGHIDLSAESNSATGIGSRVNRNLSPAQKTLSELMGTEINEQDAQHIAAKAADPDEDDGMPTGEAARCKMHCQKPGRTGCKWCGGKGYNHAMAERANKAAKVKKALERRIARLDEQIARATE